MAAGSSNGEGDLAPEVEKGRHCKNKMVNLNKYFSLLSSQPTWDKWRMKTKTLLQCKDESLKNII